MLNISNKNYVCLVVDGDLLKARDLHGNIVFHSLIDITNLDCSDNRLQSLPQLPDSILILSCHSNYLKYLPELPKQLVILRCADNRLESLPKLPETIEWLACFCNPLKFIPPLPKRPNVYSVPIQLEKLHSKLHYPVYSRRYQTYRYLISFLVLELGASVSVVSNEQFWFPGIV